jgi:hypothetical protein
MRYRFPLSNLGLERRESIPSGSFVYYERSGEATLKAVFGLACVLQAKRRKREEEKKADSSVVHG